MIHHLLGILTLQIAYIGIYSIFMTERLVWVLLKNYHDNLHDVFGSRNHIYNSWISPSFVMGKVAEKIEYVFY